MAGDTAARIRDEATRLFAERGFEGTSVRAICDAADVNLNAISYHFGGKGPLYEAVLSQGADAELASAERLLGRPARDLADLETRMLLYAEETLASYLARPEWLVLVFAEWQQGFRNCDGTATRETLFRQQRVLVDFLRAAADDGLLREGVDAEIVAGALIERLGNQVRFADAIHDMYGVSIRDPEYRRHWTEQSVSLLLHGAARPPEE